MYILNSMGILVNVYINNFYGGCRPSHSHSAFQRMNTLFDKLGLLASYPHVIVCVETDTSAMTPTVPQFRLNELHVELHQWLEKSTYMKHALHFARKIVICFCLRPPSKVVFTRVVCSMPCVIQLLDVLRSG